MLVLQGSYINLTMAFQTFPGQNYLFCQTFQGIFQLYMNKNITNLLLNNNTSYTANDNDKLTYGTVCNSIPE